jgi:glycosyltransferase involved in cell wall biosynthesis
MSVTSDVLHDQRVLRIAGTLMNLGASITIVGRKLKGPSGKTGSPIRIIRFRMLFRRGFPFYASFNIRLFFFLLFRKADILVANDLDTLLPNFLVSKLRRKSLVYDSHEYFTGVPEVQNRKFVYNVWKRIERMIFPGLKHVYTVSKAIAKTYQSEYGVDVEVVRNTPVKWDLTNQMHPTDLGLHEEREVIILQGTGINIDRGGEEAVMAMQLVEDAVLWIIGGGDVIDTMKKMTIALNLTDRIQFFDRMSYEDMMGYTSKGSLGLSLDKDTNPNYEMSLPNKIFDYIQAGIPILASDLTEVRHIIRHYDVGELIETHQPVHIAEKINYMLGDKKRRMEWKKNLKHAAEELCWENEEVKLVEIFTRIGQDL